MGHDFDGWKNAWNTCTNLREFEVIFSESVEADAAFAIVKEHLKFLTFYFTDNMVSYDVKEVIDACAKGTKCVEKLTIGGQTPVIIGIWVFGSE